MYYLLDTDLNFVAPLEGYQSVIWTTRYYESGDFEFYIPAITEMLNLLKEDYYITRDDDFTQCMIIEGIRITTDVESGNYIIVTGRSLKSILHRRVIWKQTVVEGAVEDCVHKLINENAINPAINKRKINKLVLGAKLGITETMSAQYTGDNLGEVIETICKKYALGYDILLDLEEKQFIFVIFSGADRSFNQTENPYVVFSNDFENLLKTDYVYDKSTYKNVALVAGEGEGVNRKIYNVGGASDLNRYEIFVDAKDVSSEVESENGEEKTTLSEEEYNELLSEKGTEALTETGIIENVDGDLETNYTYSFNVDYFLGDIVQVINEYGKEMTPRIIEVIENEDESGKNTVVTFATDEQEE